MATLALPRRAAGNTSVVPTLVFGIGMLGLLLGVIGSAWDVSWHRTIGRDSFWIAPHLFTYTGVMLGGVAALLATGTAMAGRPVRGRALRIGPFRAELGLALVGLASAVIVASAPFDDAWHRALGPDVDIWSPPHMTAITAGAVVYLGWATALAPGVFPIGEPVRRVLRLGLVAAAVGTAVFAMNFYYFQAITREAFFYPLLVALVVPALFAFGDALTGERYAPTRIAALYTGLALVVYAALEAAGWRPPAFPPLVLAGAVAIDVVRRRTRSPLAIGFAFCAAFVAAEWLRMTFVPQELPGRQLAGASRATQLFFQYYGQALARPWVSAWPLASVVVGGVIAAGSWLAGSRAGRSLRS